MLKIVIPAFEGYNEKTQEFVNIPETTLQLEHSLVSVSKWEAKWNKPFISTESKTNEETLDYIKFMTLTQNVDPKVYTYMNQEIMDEISEYINLPMTATTFKEDGKKNREIVTNELIYYWMISLNIPFECQKWHLNRLLTLIRVCSIKNTPAKKMSQHEVMSQNRSLNAARRAKLHTRG